MEIKCPNSKKKIPGVIPPPRLGKNIVRCIMHLTMFSLDGVAGFALNNVFSRRGGGITPGIFFKMSYSFFSEFCLCEKESRGCASDFLLVVLKNIQLRYLTFHPCFPEVCQIPRTRMFFVSNSQDISATAPPPPPHPLGEALIGT